MHPFFDILPRNPEEQEINLKVKLQKKKKKIRKSTRGKDEKFHFVALVLMLPSLTSLAREASWKIHIRVIEIKSEQGFTIMKRDERRFDDKQSEVPRQGRDPI